MKTLKLKTTQGAFEMANYWLKNAEEHLESTSQHADAKKLEKAEG